MTNYVIFGASSAIAEQTVRALAVSGAHFYLVARDAAKLEKIAADLSVRGASSVASAVYDFSTMQNLPGLVDGAVTALGGIDQALIAFGTLPDQVSLESEPLQAERDIALNFTVPALLAQFVANRLKPGGLLAVITSVAGDRGRGSNYFYGAAKGGLGLFLQGLRHKQSARSVEILDIRPGFVDTPMTRAFPKGPLWARPEAVGTVIAKAMQGRKGGRFYVPGFWALIMLVIRSVPASVMHKTKL